MHSGPIITYGLTINDKILTFAVLEWTLVCEIVHLILHYDQKSWLGIKMTWYFNLVKCPI